MLICISGVFETGRSGESKGDEARERERERERGRERDLILQKQFIYINISFYNSTIQ